MTTTPAQILSPTKTPTVKTCRECGSDFEVEFAALARWVNACPKCSERNAVEEGQRMAREAEARRSMAWDSICPPDYLHTEPVKLPRPELLHRVMAWKFGPRGLLLHGESGLGKSRCAWLLLKREHEAGRRILAIDHSIGFRYAETFSKSAADASVWIERLSEVELLFLDDIFKAKLTESLEQALFTVIAARCEHRRPVVVTTNDTGESLTARLSADRSAALIRRLVEYNDRIAFV